MAKHRWVGNGRVAPSKTKLVRSVGKATAVEGHVIRATIRTREEVGPEPARSVVPNLSAIQGEDNWLALPPSDMHGRFGKQPVAVDMGDVNRLDDRRDLSDDRGGADETAYLDGAEHAG